MFMRKIYLLAFFFAANFVANAQNTCDTINMPVPKTWSDTFYSAPTPFPGFIGGYINGVNSSGDFQKANYFDLSGTSYNYILGMFVKFGKANSKQDTNLNKYVYFKVYDGTTGTPGALLDSTQLTLGAIKSDVSKGLASVINFPSTQLPASKKIFVSVDISNFTWSLGGKKQDSIWIGTTKNNQ